MTEKEIKKLDLFTQNKKKAKLSKTDKIRVLGNPKLKAIFGHATHVIEDWKTNMVLGSLIRKEDGETIAIPAMVDKRRKKRIVNLVMT